MYDLIVKTPFGGHEVGTRLTDPELIAAIIGDERETSVIKVAPLPADPVAAEPPAVVEPEPDTSTETGPSKAARAGKTAA